MDIVWIVEDLEEVRSVFRRRLHMLQRSKVELRFCDGPWMILDDIRKLGDTPFKGCALMDLYLRDYWELLYEHGERVDTKKIKPVSLNDPEGVACAVQDLIDRYIAKVVANTNVKVFVYTFVPQFFAYGDELHRKPENGFPLLTRVLFSLFNAGLKPPDILHKPHPYLIFDPDAAERLKAQRVNDLAERRRVQTLALEKHAEEIGRLIVKQLKSN